MDPENGGNATARVRHLQVYIGTVAIANRRDILECGIPMPLWVLRVWLINNNLYHACFPITSRIQSAKSIRPHFSNRKDTHHVQQILVDS
jgi:hypothetical protein